MEVRIYGRFDGYGSRAQVSRGFRDALKARGHIVHSVDTRRAEIEDDYVVDGAFAPLGIYLSDPRSVRLLRHNARHERSYVLVAPNSDRIPDRIAAAINELATGVLAPSPWAADVLGRYFDNIEIVPHGIHPDFRSDVSAFEAMRTEYRNGEFRMLHLSTTETDRKGTLALLEAWQRWRRPQKLLTLVLDPGAHVALMRRMAEARVGHLPCVKFVERQGLPPAEMRTFYHDFHFVCQPSRGEAFGLTPLEARCSGVPVMMTKCTGHAAQVGSEGVVLIPHGELAPLDEAPGGSAPMVDADEILPRLGYAWLEWETFALATQRMAPALGEYWSWDRQLAPWIEKMEKTA